MFEPRAFGGVRVCLLCLLRAMSLVLASRARNEIRLSASLSCDAMRSQREREERTARASASAKKREGERKIDVVRHAETHLLACVRLSGGSRQFKSMPQRRKAAAAGLPLFSVCFALSRLRKCATHHRARRPC